MIWIGQHSAILVVFQHFNYQFYFSFTNHLVLRNDQILKDKQTFKALEEPIIEIDPTNYQLISFTSKAQPIVKIYSKADKNILRWNEMQKKKKKKEKKVNHKRISREPEKSLEYAMRIDNFRVKTKGGKRIEWREKQGGTWFHRLVFDPRPVWPGRWKIFLRSIGFVVFHFNFRSRCEGVLCYLLAPSPLNQQEGWAVRPYTITPT